MEKFTTKIDSAGRLTIPLKVRRELGMDAGSLVVARVIDGELRVITKEAAWNLAQDFCRPFRTGEGGELATDELSRERRDEAAREVADW